MKGCCCQLLLMDLSMFLCIFGCLMFLSSYSVCPRNLGNYFWILSLPFGNRCLPLHRRRSDCRVGSFGLGWMRCWPLLHSHFCLCSPLFHLWGSGQYRYYYFQNRDRLWSQRGWLVVGAYGLWWGWGEGTIELSIECFLRRNSGCIYPSKSEGSSRSKGRRWSWYYLSRWSWFAGKR